MKTQVHKTTSSLEETVFLDLLRTSDVLSRRIDYVLKDANLSANQYNVLRILRGAPEGLPCGEIGNRMITRDPDITRLLDRLEKRELISRCRETKDRRTVLTRITSAGVKLLARLLACGIRLVKHIRTARHYGHNKHRKSALAKRLDVVCGYHGHDLSIGHKAAPPGRYAQTKIGSEATSGLCVLHELPGSDYRLEPPGQGL